MLFCMDLSGNVFLQPDTIGVQHSFKTLTLFKDEAKEIDTLFKVQTKEKMISNTRKKQKL